MAMRLYDVDIARKEHTKKYEKKRSYYTLNNQQDLNAASDYNFLKNSVLTKEELEVFFDISNKLKDLK